MRVREYGSAGPFVVLVHGGPAAPGTMAPVARGLCDAFRVLEPFQRGAGDEPLTVARHVADLDALVRERCEGTRPAVVGASWGAMLALAWAATHPERAGALVLVGCGTFDRAARARLQATLAERIDPPLAHRLSALEDEISDRDERLRAAGELLLPVYSCELASSATGIERCDARAHHETWQDMLRLQEQGRYPAAFGAIRTPVLMLHGDLDPHPGRLIRDSLRPHLPQLEYRQLPHCGHSPWLERRARGRFFALLRRWLVAHR